MDSLKIHNFYLIGKENYDEGLNSTVEITRNNLPSELKKFNPPKFVFRETIHEVGFTVKSEYEKFKYYQENETIVVTELFHFKDFDVDELNLWASFELLFHQGYLYGLSFKSSNLNIYERLAHYLEQIYGEHKKITLPSQSTSTRSWFSGVSLNSIYLEIAQNDHGVEWVELTFYDGLVHMMLNRQLSVYPIIRNVLYEEEASQESIRKSFYQKSIDKISSLVQPKKLSIDECKTAVNELLSPEISISSLKSASEYIVTNISGSQLNLQWCDWLMEIAVNVQNAGLLIESELIYKLVIGWFNSNSITSKEKTLLVACAYKNLINVCCDNNRFDEAILNFNQSITILENHCSANDYNFHSIAGASNYNIARVYHEIEKYSLAIEHNRKALSHLEYLVTSWMSDEDKETILLAFQNLGNALTKIENYDDASSTYVTALRYAFDNNRYFNYALFCFNLANVWLKTRNYEGAENQYQHLLDFIRGNPRIFLFSDLQGEILSQLADLYKEILNPSEELRYLSEAIVFYSDALERQPQMNSFIDSLRTRMSELQKNLENLGGN